MHRGRSFRIGPSFLVSTSSHLHFILPGLTSPINSASSGQTVNAIETEKYDPSLPLAFKIAKIFRKPVDEIFKRKLKDLCADSRLCHP